MDPPQPLKKKNYFDAVKSSNPEEMKEYIAVPGIEGARGEHGPRGERGEQGDTGPQGPRGDIGKTGPQGVRGGTGGGGEGYDSVSGQHPGWVYYKNKDGLATNLGPERGSDGWVFPKFELDKDGSTDTYMSQGSNSLIMEENNMLSFKSLKIGAKVDIRYDFEITTYSNYTELWIRLFNEKCENLPTSYVANFKYQYSYDMSFFQTLYIDNNRIKSYPVRPEFRSDAESSIILKGMYLSVC